MKRYTYHIRRFKLYPGFTFVEMTVVLSILITIIGLVAVNLIQARQNVSINTTVATLVSDLRAQQVKAMNGETQNTGSADSYGIHFDQNDYVLFKGTSYSAGSSSNQIVQLDSTLQFTTANINMIFLKPSGQLSGSNSATLYDTTGKVQRQINVNSIGVITNVN